MRHPHHSAARLLVVDDEPGIHRAVERILGPRYDVVSAFGAEEALAAADSSETPFDVALVDIRMPVMDGFEVMSRLKRGRPGIDVILMTGSTDESDEKLVRALQSDAYYFLLKPFEKGVLEALLDRCVSARRVREKNRAYLEELERELRHARDLQRSLLPPPLPSASSFRAAASFRPCLAVGGDVYDWKPFGSERLLVLVADVSGHGVPAAMIAAMIKASFDRIMEPLAPSEALLAIRAGLLNLEADRFVSAMVATLDVARDVLVYASAGHPASLLIRQGQHDVLELPPTGRVLSSVIPPALADSPEYPFGPGDRLVLCTDGVTEARNPGEEMFGLGRLEGALRDAPGGDLAPVLARLDRFRDGRPPADDETLVSISRVASATK